MLILRSDGFLRADVISSSVVLPLLQVQSGQKSKLVSKHVADCATCRGYMTSFTLRHSQTEELTSVLHHFLLDASDLSSWRLLSE